MKSNNKTCKFCGAPAYANPADGSKYDACVPCIIGRYAIEKPETLGKQIVVIDNGFVHVGDCSRLPDGSLRIDDCENVRVWGTERGLGQLAAGPTSKTITDECGIVIVPADRVVFFIAVKDGAWA
jgi:hypothetical protein